jgi:hypothetical protein
LVRADFEPFSDDKSAKKMRAVRELKRRNSAIFVLVNGNIITFCGDCAKNNLQLTAFASLSYMTVKDLSGFMKAP